MFKKQVKCSECGFLGIPEMGPDNVWRWQEIQPQRRVDIFRAYKDTGPCITCMRGQEQLIASDSSPGEPGWWDKILQSYNDYRNCIYFYPYNPGYTPNQHLELLIVRNQRRFLIPVSIVSAAVGAGVATAANFIFSIFSR